MISSLDITRASFFILIFDNYIHIGNESIYQRLKPLQPNIRLSGQPNIRPAEYSAEHSANFQIFLQAGSSRLFNVWDQLLIQNRLMVRRMTKCRIKIFMGRGEVGR